MSLAVDHDRSPLEALQLRHVEQRLVEEFAALVEPELVQRKIREAEAAFGRPRVRHYLPILIERRVRADLRGCVTQ